MQPYDATLGDALNRVRRAQWPFNPLIINGSLYRNEVPAERILPLTPRGDSPFMDYDTSAVYYQASVPPCCIDEWFLTTVDSHYIMLKLLSPADRHLWDNEAFAYGLIDRSLPPRPLNPPAVPQLPESAVMYTPLMCIRQCLGILSHTPAGVRNPVG